MSRKQGMNELLNRVFPNLSTHFHRVMLAERAILASLNTAVDELNEECIKKLPGNIVVCNSADFTVDPDDVTRFTTEFLNSITPVGIPPHRLILKIGSPLMLLLNINPKNGLCNGTRLISVNRNLLQCQFAGGENDGRTVLLPRIMFKLNDNDPKEFPVEWQRREFPVRTAFAMTINKSQGQSPASFGV